jgi:hypothetical protein
VPVKIALKSKIRYKASDDVMSVIENNGEVTLPGNGRSDALLTRRQILMVIIVTLGITVLILLRLRG